MNQIRKRNELFPGSHVRTAYINEQGNFILQLTPIEMLTANPDIPSLDYIDIDEQYIKSLSWLEALELEPNLAEIMISLNFDYIDLFKEKCI